jgi:peptide/nickel transport system permease protein
VQGLSSLTICARHLIPNLAELVVAQATLVFAWAMVDLAAISFLGLGVQAPTADWGVMVSTGETGVLQGYPMESLSAGACIVLVVVAVNLLGERIAARDERRG